MTCANRKRKRKEKCEEKYMKTREEILSELNSDVFELAFGTAQLPRKLLFIDPLHQCTTTTNSHWNIKCQINTYKLLLLIIKEISKPRKSRHVYSLLAACTCILIPRMAVL